MVGLMGAEACAATCCEAVAVLAFAPEGWLLFERKGSALADIVDEVVDAGAEGAVE